MQGNDVCRWCEADLYRDGRCWRCGQPERTCNEVAGRSFRMTWDDRSEHCWLWGITEGDDWPRSPSFRVETACRRIREAGFTMPSLADIVEMQRRYLVDAVMYPKDVLFGKTPENAQWSGWGPGVVDSLTHEG